MIATGAGIGVITQLARAAFEQHAADFTGMGRQRIRLGARRIKRACAGLARDTQVPFRFGVVRLEIGVGNGPIGEAGARDRALLAGSMKSIS